jgi:4-amino-4-deoxy-L-arabinose transferase-like glycosyltransferase
MQKELKQRLRLGSRWMNIPGRTRVAILVGVVVLVAYLLLLLLIPHYKGTPTTDGDEPHYLVITQSLIRDGDFAVKDEYKDKTYHAFYEGNISLPHIVKGRNGQWVSTHPPFISIVVLPGFRLFGQRGAAFTMILMTVLAAMLTFALADRFVDRRIALLLTLFFFLSYPLLFYSRLVYPETAALMLLIVGAWSAWRLKETMKPRFAALNGLAAGLLLLFHPKFIALAAALLLVTWLVARPNLKLLWWWALPATICVVGLLILTGYVYGPNLIKGLSASGGSKVMGGYLGTNSVWGVFGLFIDRAWGLLIFAPLFALFPLGLSLQNTKLDWTRWWIFFPVAILAHALVLGIFQSWNGGAAPVQRYLVPVAALMVVCVALYFERCRSQVARGFGLLLAIAQVVTTVWAFRFMVGTYGMAGTDNTFLAHFLGANNPITKFLLWVFPLYHPGGVKSVFLTIVWLVLLVVLIILARRSFMKRGGWKISGIVGIEPFELKP